MQVQLSFKNVSFLRSQGTKRKLEGETPKAKRAKLDTSR